MVVAQWLQRGALPMSLSAVRFWIPLGAGFSEKYHVWTIFRCCVLEQDTLPSDASLDSGVNEYLVRQRWQCVRLVPSAEMVASAVCSKEGVEMVHEWTGSVTRGDMCEAHRALYVRYIRTQNYFFLIKPLACNLKPNCSGCNGGMHFQIYEITTFEPTRSRRQFVAYKNKMDKNALIIHQHTHFTKQIGCIFYVLI